MPSGPTRRDLLCRGVGLATLGAVGTTAGCLGLRPFGDEEPSPRDEIRRWAPTPGALADTRATLDEHYTIQARNLRALRSTPDRVREVLMGSPPERYEPLGIAPADVAGSVLVGQHTRVNRVDHDADAVAGRLRSIGFERSGAVGDVRLFRGALPIVGSAASSSRYPVLLGLDGSYVLEDRADDGRWAPAESLVRAVAAAGAGDGTRYADTNDDVETLLRHLDTTLSAFVRSMEPVAAEAASPEYGRFEGMVGRGVGAEASDGRLRAVQVFPFEDAESVPSADAIDTYHEAGAFSGDRLSLRHQQTTVDGRVLEMVYETDIGDAPA